MVSAQFLSAVELAYSGQCISGMVNKEKTFGGTTNGNGIGLLAVIGRAQWKQEMTIHLCEYNGKVIGKGHGNRGNKG